MSSGCFLSTDRHNILENTDGGIERILQIIDAARAGNQFKIVSGVVNKTKQQPHVMNLAVN